MGQVLLLVFLKFRFTGSSPTYFLCNISAAPNCIKADQPIGVFQSSGEAPHRGGVADMPECLCCGFAHWVAG